jgi:hypothetical protein
MCRLCRDIWVLKRVFTIKVEDGGGKGACTTADIRNVTLTLHVNAWPCRALLHKASNNAASQASKKGLRGSTVFKIIGALPRHPHNARSPINITALSQRLAKDPLSFDRPAIGLALGDEGRGEGIPDSGGERFGGGC